MENNTNPIFYKGFLKRNLTENPALLLICACADKLELKSAYVLLFICAIPVKLELKNKKCFTPMRNVIFLIFYKGLSKANLTENPAETLICVRVGKLECVLVCGFVC